MMIADEIQTFIREYSRKEVDEINADTAMAAELGIDSLAFVRMVNDAETKFDVIIEDEDLIGIRTVGDFAKLLQR